jgi:hypothetical protein
MISKRKTTNDAKRPPANISASATAASPQSPFLQILSSCLKCFPIPKFAQLSVPILVIRG